MKIKILISVVFVICLCATAFGQDKTVRWQEGTSNSDTLLVQGHTCRTINVDGVTVLSSIYYTDKLIRVDILVDNKSERRINVNPSAFTFSIVRPKPKNLKLKSPEELAKSVNRKAKLHNILAGLGGDNATKETTTTITNDRGFPVGTSTTTSPDYEARREAQETQKRNTQAANDAVGYLNSIYLRANTLFPGQRAIGSIFFEKEKNIDEGVLQILIGNTTFEFPYSSKSQK